jgi:CNT family concentrative nucleoside transporter
MASSHSEPHPYATPAVSVTPNEQQAVQRKVTQSSESFIGEKHHTVDPEILLAKDTEEVEAARTRRHDFYCRFRPFILTGVALVILGWWISAIVLKATRHRW